MLAFQKRLPYSPPLPIGGTARPVWAAVAVRKRRKTGDENAQAQDEERRQKTLQAHRHRQGETRRRWQAPPAFQPQRSEEHTSELQSLMRTSYAVICLKKKKRNQ